MPISVIIPVFNGEKTIKETIYSILNQTFQDIEVIISDDGSTDSTLEVVRNISDSRIKILSYPNAGVSASRNRGIYEAKGEYISFIDADDLWTPDKLELQWQALENNSQAAVAYSWTDYISESGQFIKSGRRIKANGDVFSKLLVINFLENGSNPLIRKEALEKVGSFDESLSSSEDIDLWLKLSIDYEFVCIEKPQIFYRTSMNSLSSNLKNMEATSLKVIKRAFRYPKAHNLQHLKKQTISNFYKYLTFKAIESIPETGRNMTTMYFLWNYFKNKPADIMDKKLMLIIAVKFLFPKISQRVIQFKKTAFT
ncbi:putative glycosyltransferase [Rivularia sp. PCC 7116]|uniref:glycosyltransferase n=1 Tax=Rivularia sp. PCC 7116 TaxID=373994 RepID=UPI00029EF7D3|nr:glycosyltransferase [Rivularia sp. PCC 7116]AFY54117.1 putative glycosyltransferase [Rivularia sp. PCC 7116]